MLQNKDVIKVNRMVHQMSGTQMRELNHFIVDLLKTQRKLENLKASTAFCIGDKVRTASDLRPDRYADILCKITAIRQTKCTVTVLEGSLKGISFRCPAGALIAAKKGRV